MRRKKREAVYKAEVESPHPSLRVRFARFLGLVGTLFAVSVAVVVTQRLSQDSLALIVGLTCGIAAMLPTLVMGGILWRRESNRHLERLMQEAVAREQQSSMNPPVIIVSPPGVSGYGDQQPTLTHQQSPWGWASSHGKRDFKIIGNPD
jgi:hypothetical protein